jgi:cell division protein FtsN
VETAAKPQEDASMRDQLDWYKRVNKPGEATKGLEPAPEPAKAVVKAPEPPVRPVATASGPGGYSVQVGAFRQRREADAKATQLKAKGYDCVMESPASPKALFLLKVGRYNTRADAVAMQRRLQRDGFTSFVKAAN